MNTHWFLPIAAVMALCGCSHVAVRIYSGVVQRVETGELVGYTVSPVSNSVSTVVHPVHVFVNVADAGAPRLVRIDFLDPADPRPLGKAGDRITFDLRGDLPVDGHIAAEALTRYTVAR